MPIFSRKQLRRSLGLEYLRDTTLGTTQLSVSIGSFMQVMDPAQANLDYSGQNLYGRAYIRAGSADYRVGSYNFQSGSFLAQQAVLLVSLGSGGDYEIHSRLPAPDLDRCIDQTILELRVEREIGVPSLPGAFIYNIDGAASPHTLVDYNEVYFYASPDSTTNRNRGDFNNVNLVHTPTGNELRLNCALNASQRVVIDAILQLTLGAGDEATINVPDRDWVLWGAAARAYNMLIQQTPGQDATLLKERRAEAARAFTKKSQRWQPGISRRITLDTPDTEVARRQGTGYWPW